MARTRPCQGFPGAAAQVRLGMLSVALPRTHAPRRFWTAVPRSRSRNQRGFPAQGGSGGTGRSPRVNQPDAGSLPPPRRSGRTSAPSGRLPVSSATIPSSSPRRAARPLSASATGSGRCAQSASGPSGRSPGDAHGMARVADHRGVRGHVVDHDRVRADLRAVAHVDRAEQLGAGAHHHVVVRRSGGACRAGSPCRRASRPGRASRCRRSARSRRSPRRLPWSMNGPSPIWAAGWISTPVATRVALASRRGASGTPVSCSACATRCASSACTPP